MKNRLQTFAVTIIILLLSACGGSSSDKNAEEQPSTTTPPPDTTPNTDTNTGGKDGLYTGTRTSIDNTTTSDVQAILSPNGSVSIFIKSEEITLTSQLNPDSNNDIETSAIVYKPDGNTLNIELQGVKTETGFELTWFEEGEETWKLLLSFDADKANVSSSIDGYYATNMNSEKSLAAVIDDNTITMNIDNRCHLSGTITPLADVVFFVDVSIEDIAPKQCPYNGMYSGLSSISKSPNNATPELILTLQNGRKAISEVILRDSEVAEFKQLPRGIYSAQNIDQKQFLSFSVSQTGSIRGYVSNKHFAGYFNAHAKYSGDSYVIHHENTRLYNKSSWKVQSGNITLSDDYWQKIFTTTSPESTEYSNFDSTMVFISSERDGTTWDFEFALPVTRKMEMGSPIPFNELAGHYQNLPAKLDIIIDPNGTISGIYTGCEISGSINALTDGDITELQANIVASNCPETHSFNINGEFSGFGFVPYYSDEDYFDINLFLSGNTERGEVTNTLNLSSKIKL